MSGMFDLLNKAGFEVTEEKFEEWMKPSEVQYPFGLSIPTEDNRVTTVTLESIKGINFIRKSMKKVTDDEFKRLCPVNSEDPIYKYLLENVNRVRVISKGEYRRVDECKTGYTHTHYQEWELVRDTPHGFSDVICMFGYSSVSKRMLFRFSTSAINLAYQKQLKNSIKCLVPDIKTYTSYYEEGLELFNNIVSLVDKSPYLLVCVNTYDGVVVSHKKYRDKSGLTRDEVTRPCLGENIKKNAKIMDRLQPWLKLGGYIRDRSFYLICEDKADHDKLYLSLWRGKIPDEYVVVF